MLRVVWNMGIALEKMKFIWDYKFNLIMLNISFEYILKVGVRRIINAAWSKLTQFLITETFPSLMVSL